MFIKFKSSKIAKNCQKELDGYFMFNKQIKVTLASEDKTKKIQKMQKEPKKFRFVPW